MQSSLPYRLGTTPVFEFVRIGTDADVGRTAAYYADDFSDHRTVAEAMPWMFPKSREPSRSHAAGEVHNGRPGCITDHILLHESFNA